MGRKSTPPDGWITLHLVARATELAHYPGLVLRLCREIPPRILIRRYRGVRCVREHDVPELGRRIDAWLADPKWTRFARRKRRRKRRRPSPG